MKIFLFVFLSFLQGILVSGLSIAATSSSYLGEASLTGNSRWTVMPEVGVSQVSFRQNLGNQALNQTSLNAKIGVQYDFGTSDLKAHADVASTVSVLSSSSSKPSRFMSYNAGVSYDLPFSRFNTKYTLNVGASERRMIVHQVTTDPFGYSRLYGPQIGAGISHRVLGNHVVSGYAKAMSILNAKGSFSRNIEGVLGTNYTLLRFSDFKELRAGVEYSWLRYETTKNTMNANSVLASVAIGI